MTISRNKYLALASSVLIIVITYHHSSIAEESVKETLVQTKTSHADQQASIGQQKPVPAQADNQHVLTQKIATLQKRIVQQQAEINHLNEQLIAQMDINNINSDDQRDEMQVSDEIAEQDYIDNNVALLDSMMESESFDSDWSDQSTEKITQLVNSELFQGSELISANCAATLCRIETEAKDEEAAEQFIANFPSLIDWPSTTFVQLNALEEGKQSIVFFVSREGMPLPEANETA